MYGVLLVTATVFVSTSSGFPCFGLERRSDLPEELSRPFAYDVTNFEPAGRARLRPFAKKEPIKVKGSKIFPKQPPASTNEVKAQEIPPKISDEVLIEKIPSNVADDVKIVVIPQASNGVPPIIRDEKEEIAVAPPTTNGAPSIIQDEKEEIAAAPPTTNGAPSIIHDEKEEIAIAPPTTNGAPSIIRDEKEEIAVAPPTTNGAPSIIHDEKEEIAVAPPTTNAAPSIIRDEKEEIAVAPPIANLEKAPFVKDSLSPNRKDEVPVAPPSEDPGTFTTRRSTKTKEAEVAQKRNKPKIGQNNMMQGMMLGMFNMFGGMMEKY